MGVLEATAAPAATGRGRAEPKLKSESLRKWLTMVVPPGSFGRRQTWEVEVAGGGTLGPEVVELGC